MILLFGTTPRCGSTSINKSLNRSTDINILVEPFNPDSNKHIKKGSDNLIVREDIESVFDTLKNMPYSGIKHLAYQIPMSDLQRLFDITHKVVFIHREDQLEVALSEWMSVNYKQKTGHSFWNEWDKAEGGHTKKDFLDFHTLMRDPMPIGLVNHKYKLLNKNLKIYRRMAQRKQTYYITYEKWYDENVQANFLGLCNFLGCHIKNNQWKKFLSPADKFNLGNIKYELIPNATELRNTIGNN